MITKEQYIQNLEWEIGIIKHLAEKITPDMLDYRPSEKQRSTLELLQYLGHIFATGAEANIAGSSDKYIELGVARESVTFENFAEKMDAQMARVRELVLPLTDAELETAHTIFGNTATLAMHMLSVLKWAVGYKMQLFMYLKANGLADIGTSNLWAGFDTPPKE